jgi:hypothetical protein
LRAGVEECDAGGAAAGDGCSASCLRCAGGDRAFAWASNGHCYTRHDVPLSWEAARRDCQAAGGDLFAYSSYRELEIVGPALLGERASAFWIGLGRRAAAPFAWVTAEPLPPPAPGWAPGEPRARPDEESCAFQSPAAAAPAAPGAWPWTAARCDRPLPYVCERAPWTVRAENRHGYKAFFRPLPWDGARAACAALGAHLVTIADAAENDFMSAQAHAPLWMGAHDRVAEGAFAWITGEPFAFTAFAPLEPDDLGDADCVAMGPDRLWHDRACATAYGFMCEIE